MIASYRSDARLEACTNVFVIFSFIGMSEVEELEDAEPEDEGSRDSEPGESEPGVVGSGNSKSEDRDPGDDEERQNA
jgi:hypothetical protein